MDNHRFANQLLSKGQNSVSNKSQDYNHKLLEICSVKDRRIMQLEHQLKNEKKRHKACRHIADRRKRAMIAKDETIRSMRLKQKEKDTVAKRDKKLLNMIKNNPILLECLENSFRNKHARRYRVSRPVASRQMISSSSTYKALRAEGVLILPHPKTVVRWHRHISNLPGFNTEILKIVKNAADHMSELAKVVAILVDGMAIKPFVDYHAISDRIFGFPDNGKLEDNEKNSTDCLATEAIVVMIRSLHTKFKQVIGYFLANSTLGSSRQKDIILEAIDLIRNVGLHPVLVIMDQHPTNVKMAHELGVTIDNPEFVVKNSEVVFMYDTPHLFKSLRNNMLVKNILVNGKIVSFKYIRDLYHSDLHSVPRLAPNLIQRAVYPNTFDRMNVKLAVRALSRTTAKAIETSVSLESMSPAAIATADFISMTDQLFDIFNSRFIQDSAKPLRSALTDNSEHWEVLDEMRDLLSSMMFIPQECFDPQKALSSSHSLNSTQKAPPCVSGLLHNISAIKKLWSIVSDKHDFKYLRTNKVNQDPLENDFSCVRRSCGNNDTPNAQQFGVALKTCCIKKSLLSISNSNCEDDNNVSIVANDEPAEGEEEDRLAGCDEFTMIPFEPLDENLPELDLLEKNALVYVVGYSVSKLTHEDCRRNLSQSREAEDVDENIFCILKRYEHSANFVIPTKAALDVGIHVHIAFKQKFKKFMATSRKGVKLRLKEYVDYDHYTTIVCCTCFNSLINRLLNTFIKAEMRKMQQALRAARKTKNGKARRMGLHNVKARRSKPKKSHKTASAPVSRKVKRNSPATTGLLQTEFVSIANTEEMCGSEFDKNPLTDEPQNATKCDAVHQENIVIVDPEVLKMQQNIEVLEKLVQLFPQREYIDIDHRDCYQMSTTEITNTYQEFQHELKYIFDKHKRCPSRLLSKNKSLLTFEDVSGVFTDDQLYVMVLYLDQHLVSSEESGLFSDLIDDVLVYEWGIRIFMQIHNFTSREEALAHIKLQEDAEIYN